MKKKTIISIGIITSVGVSALVAVMESMFSLASRRKSFLFDREYRLRKKELSDAYPETIQSIIKKSDELIRLNLEKVTIQSHDGLTLVGHYYPAKNAKRTIIMFHGWKSYWNLDFATVTPYLHENNCNLLFVEQRGHGDSEGKYISFGVLERFDVKSWVDYTCDYISPSLPIYLYGVSMGASTVMMSASLDFKNKVNGIIADCGYTSPDEIIQDVLSKRKIPSLPTLSVAGRISKIHAGFNYNEYSTIEAMKESKIPILFVHGNNDTFVPVEMTYKNYDSCTAPKDILIVQNCDHGMSYAVNPTAYQEKLEHLFKNYDNN